MSRQAIAINGFIDLLLNAKSAEKKNEYATRIKELKRNRNLSKFHVWFPTYRNRNKKRGIYEQPTRNRRVTSI